MIKLDQGHSVDLGDQIFGEILCRPIHLRARSFETGSDLHGRAPHAELPAALKRSAKFFFQIVGVDVIRSKNKVINSHGTSSLSVWLPWIWIPQKQEEVPLQITLSKASNLFPEKSGDRTMNTFKLSLIAAMFAVSTAHAHGLGFEDPEAAFDAAQGSVSDLEWALRGNPDLVSELVNNALRSSPDVVKGIVRDTLLRNPEVVVQALQEFQRQQAQGQVQTAPAAPLAERATADFVDRAANAGDAPTGGNPNGQIVIVKFDDHNCPYCRQMHAAINQIVSENDNIRVVYRTWPILNLDSVAVARLSLAADRQGLHGAFNDALMSAQGTLTEARALQIAAEVGLDVDQLKVDSIDPLMARHINTTRQLAQEAAFRGTPAMLIGDTFVRGMVPQDQLETLIEQKLVD